MKLSKLYSSNTKFKTVRFNPEFNVVLGEVTNESNLNQDAHNLGKSTLIALIDFMLLKELKKGHFLKKNIFSGYVFYLEIVLNSGKYVTIRRAIDKNTKISFLIHDDAIDARKNSEWDYEDMPLTGADDSNPKKLLNRLLGFDILPNEEYRKTSGYFLRTQDDYKDIFKLQKHQGKDVDWKPILFELLGFCGEHMVNKYNIEAEISIKEQLIDKVRQEFKVDAGEKDKIKGLIEIANEKKIEIETWLDKFDFYQKEVGLNRETIELVETTIAKLNSERYNLQFEVQQIDESLKVQVNYNLDEIVEIYKEVGICFPDQLVKQYEELIQFNENVSKERMKYLQIVKQSKTERLIQIEDELNNQNEKRKQLLAVLKGTNTFQKYNVYRSDLINVEKEIERYLVELNSIDHVKSIQEDINKLKSRLEIEKKLLYEQIDESTSVYKSIRKDFHEYVLEILDSNAMLSLNLNGNGNVDFVATFYDLDNEETAEGYGHTYKKLLCACFDLAIVKNYMDRSFYRFIYHDGCLESLDPRKQKKYLDLVRRVSKEYNIQYILTCLSSDIPTEERYKISEIETAVKLSDAEDDSGRLFGFSF